jgi:glycosyltransferase involved in cell wall biosynthesis
MKNLIVVTTHTGGGGIGRYICGLVEELAQRDWQITVYCLKHQNNAFNELPNVKVKAFKIIRRFPRALKYYAFARRVYQLTKNLNIPILSTVRIFNPSLIVVGGVHATHTATRKKSLSLFDKIEIYLEKTAYKNTKYIIAHSPLMPKEISVYNLGVQNKIHMIYPPVSTSTFKFSDEHKKAELRQKLNLPNEKFLIVSAGTCDENKGIPLAAEALKQLPDNYHLMIFGSHYNMPLTENAKHYGEVNNLQDYFAAADCTLVPSRYEAFGLVVVESLQCGTPVIITKTVGAIDLVSQSEGIILEDRSSESIKNALIEMNTNPRKIEPDFVGRKNLTWDYHTTKIEELLNTIY